MNVNQMAGMEEQERLAYSRPACCICFAVTSAYARDPPYQPPGVMLQTWTLQLCEQCWPWNSVFPLTAGGWSITKYWVEGSPGNTECCTALLGEALAS
eukprot:1158051-Pelagomonas_calceolata.AAC.1